MSDVMSIEAGEAQLQFPDLLRQASGGVPVTITRNGRAIAKLVPVEPSTEDGRWETVQAMRRLAAKHSLGDIRLQELITEGRK